MSKTTINTAKHSPLRDFEGHSPQLGEGVFIDPTALVLGQVSLAEQVSVWPQAVIRGDMHRISIGARSNVQDGAVLHITHDSDFNPGGFALEIGCDVTIGHQAMLHGCTLKDRVLVGMKAMVMDGAVVESDVVIAAGALVPPGKVLRSGHLYVGSPAKCARPINETEARFFEYSAANYVRLKNRHLAS